MAAQQVAQALVAIGEIEVRQAVAAGELDHLGELELSEEEQQMVVSAAQDLREYNQESPAVIASVYAAQGPIEDEELQVHLNEFLQRFFGGDIGSFAAHNWVYV